MQVAASRSRDLWFWQTSVSPHMAVLADALAARGHAVTYVAQEELAPDRVTQGWAAPNLRHARLRMAPDDASAARLVAAAGPESVHLVQGLRGAGTLVGVRRALATRRLDHWVMMETVDDAGWCGVLKRLEYRRLIVGARKSLRGCLAIGHPTACWVVARGMPSDRVFPFAYFLAAENQTHLVHEDAEPFRFIFVGQSIARKRLKWLLSALDDPCLSTARLTVIGSGPLEAELKADAEQGLGARLSWAGRVPQQQIGTYLARADCLVLPSRHDGWGAVVSEALMVGTPAICSDACGAATAVRASGAGDVFPTNDRSALTAALVAALRRGRPTKENRLHLARWARCLNADAGAEYLTAILDHADGQAPRPPPPWQAEPGPGGPTTSAEERT